MSKLTTEFTRQKVDLVILTLDQCALTYGVSPCTASNAPGGECYNTFATCQDKANYDKDTVDIKFCSVDTIPFPGVDFYEPILVEVNPEPTEIEDSELIKARLKFKLANYATDTLAGALVEDPYARNRSSYSGTRLKKLITRNRNIKGRPVKRYTGAIGDSFSDYILTFEGVVYNFTADVNGDVSFEAEDLLAKLEDTSIPAEVELSLVADITDSANTLTLSDASLVDAPPGYVYIDSELIKYTTRNTTTNVLGGLSRAQEGTAAAEHSADTAVQPVYWTGWQDWTDILQDILDLSGIDAANIDTSTFTTVKTTPVQDIPFQGFIVEPTKASDLYFEILNTVDASSWVNEDGLVTVARNLQNAPGRSFTSLTEDSDILTNSQKVDINLESAITRAFLFWDWIIGEAEDSTDGFNRVAGFIDGDAEGANDKNEVLTDRVYSRFIRSGTGSGTSTADLEAYVKAIVARRVIRRLRAREILDFNCEIKRYEIRVGGWVYLTTKALEDENGTQITNQAFMVMKRTEGGAVVGLKCLRAGHVKWGYWAPDTAPDYDSATDADKQYGYWADDNGEIPNGTASPDPGYRWY